MKVFKSVFTGENSADEIIYNAGILNFINQYNFIICV